MTSNSTVVSFRQPDEIDDPLTAVLRSGARRLLAQAIEAEAEAFLAAMKDKRLADGRERVARHGHGPERLVQTGIGPVAVQRVKLRDRRESEAGAERIRFTSAILPRWARRTRSLDALLPVLYLRGVSMGDFQEALGALLGKEAPNLSPSVVARLRDEWEADYTRWQRRDLSARHYVYVWADGIYLQARMEPQAECPTTKASRGHARADRRHPGGQEGAGRLPGGRAGKCPELAGAAGRPQGARPGHRARAGHRRRGTRLLESARCGITVDPASTLHSGAVEKAARF
jgi:hypothetical protein